MIKFFRKIRQNLLSTETTGKHTRQTGKYFKYAIGEIVLVVVGILIALQANNWNEKQIQNAEFEIVVEQIYNAVKNDAEAFNAYENRITEQINLIDTLLIKPESIEIKMLPIF